MRAPTTSPTIVIHGGAGAIAKSALTAATRANYEQALHEILARALTVLHEGGTAIDAVTIAVQLLEDNPLFNAGHGAVFTRDARHELDASIMDGATQQAGAVAGLTTIKNPVLAARAVMENSEHVMLVGPGAEAFVVTHGVEQVAPDYFSTEFRRAQLRRVQAQGRGAAFSVLDHDGGGGVAPAPLDDDKKMGTVGAVALDAQGRLAAATSTGGMTNKAPGRVGDSPIIGAGCYASNLCAVSCTGVGEAFMRLVVGHEIHAQLRYGGKTLREAAENVVHQQLPAIGGDGGLIAVDPQGNVAMPFNTEGMYRGVATRHHVWVAIHD